MHTYHNTPSHHISHMPEINEIFERDYGHFHDIGKLSLNYVSPLSSLPVSELIYTKARMAC